jgi:L-2-hydroxyglutarate oxidase LhgO
MDKVDCIVVGAGVVGLAVARRLALSGHEVIVLEAESAIGTGISSRNSEVVHAGIYYPKNSLKARLCVRGRKLLYDYCAEHGVEARRVGKFIVATDETQTVVLKSIYDTAIANGVGDIKSRSGIDTCALMPQLKCEASLFSPSTGIIDSHGYMLALQGDIEAAGGAVAFLSPMMSARHGSDGYAVDVGGEAPTVLGCDILVNAAGLDAVSVARRIHGLDRKHIPHAHLAKGVYFSLSGQRSPFSHLIYPVPEPGGLGIHATLDLAGQVRFGPDVEWVTERNHDVDPRRAEKFYTAIRNYWPGLQDDALVPAYAGIRPKISGPGEPAADFIIQGSAEHGVPGLVNLFGIESPGLTASLAIADYLAETSLSTDYPS